MIVIMVGPPGSGKGTQAGLLEAKYGFKVLTASDALKAEKTEDPEFGVYYEKFQKDHPGELLPDDITIRIMAKWAAKPEYQDGVVFDGFPRTLNQAIEFDKFLARDGRRVGAVVELHFDEQDYQLLVDRQLGRAQKMRAEGKTPRETDLDPNVARKRVDIYWHDTAPIVDYYDRQGILISVNGAEKIPDVEANVDEGLERIMNPPPVPAAVLPPPAFRPS